MYDLMWSDPDEISDLVPSPRGAGCLFGGGVVEEFNRVNSLTVICRAYQLIMEGYREMLNKALVTVWSAPNYCYRCNNVVSILRLD
jgi:diadenosine tetraphosphatase ApaH/serine/threonine PP2A family protein phosphatase